MLNERQPVSVLLVATSPRFMPPQLEPMFCSAQSTKKCRQSLIGSESTRALKVTLPALNVPVYSMRASWLFPIGLERSEQRPSLDAAVSTDHPPFALAGTVHPDGMAQFMGKTSGSKIVTVAEDGLPIA